MREQDPCQGLPRERVAEQSRHCREQREEAKPASLVALGGVTIRRDVRVVRSIPRGKYLHRRARRWGTPGYRDVSTDEDRREPNEGDRDTPGRNQIPRLKLAGPDTESASCGG